MRKNPPLRTVRDAILVLGGYSEAVTLLGVSRNLIYRWEAQGLPARRMMQIAALAQKMGLSGVTPDRLAKVVPTKQAA